MIAVASSLTEQVLNGSVLLSFPISIVAGLVAFLSPCVLPLVPAYLSYITGLTGLELTAKAARGRILWGTILFILGFRKSLPVTSIPTTIILDKNKKVAARISGAITIASLSNLIEKIDSESAK